MENSSEFAKSFQKLLDKFGLNFQVKEFSESTKTSKEAAEQIGCEIGQIAKSIVFHSKTQSILVIASGSNRISTKKLEKELNEKIEIMKPDDVKRITGYSIGGVPPIGHKNPLGIFVDEDLLKYKIIWAAAGTQKTVFSLTPQDLVKISSGKVINIKE